MIPFVFECPLCHTPFQALPEMAGTAVQCPNCTGAIQLPALSDLSAQAGAKPQPAAPAIPPPAQNDVLSLDCPKCKRVFGYTREMVGQVVACPHCRDRFSLDSELVTPQLPESPGSSLLGIPPESQRHRFRGYRPSKSPPQIVPTPVFRLTKPSSIEPLAATLAASGSALVPEVETGSPPSLERREQVTRVLDPANWTEPEPGSESGEILVDQKQVKAKAPQSAISLLLPPKFSSTDPTLIRYRTSKDDPFVLIPSAQGGYQRVNTAVVRIEHDGKSILLATPPSGRMRRRRLIINLITALVCGTILYFAFRWLLN